MPVTGGMSGGGSGRGSGGGQRGSGFVGLATYLNANQGAGQRMGDELADRVAQQGAAATGAIDAASDAFDQDVAGGTAHYYSGLTPYGAAGAYEDAAYKGPNEFQTGNLGAQAQSAEQQALMLNTDAGRAALLRMQNPGAGYTTGESMLDAALAGRGAGERLASTAGQYGKLQGYLSGAKDSANAKVDAAKKQTEDVRQQYATDMQKPIPGQTPAPTAPPSRIGTPAVDPRVGNAQRIQDENKFKARYGIRG